MAVSLSYPEARRDVDLTSRPRSGGRRRGEASRGRPRRVRVTRERGGVFSVRAPAGKRGHPWRRGSGARPLRQPQRPRHPAALGGGFRGAGIRCGWRREQEVAGGDGLGDVDQLAARPPGVGAEQLEGLSLVDRMALHQDSLGPLGERAAAKRALQAVELGEAAQDDVDRALKLLRIAVGDVGEDPALGRLVDELGVLVSRIAITGQAAS